MKQTVTICYIALLLAACTAYSYQPDVTAPIGDQTQYRADVKACQDELQQKREANLPYTTFGAAGYLAMLASGKEDTLYGNKGILNRCMAAKGYEIKS